MKRFLLIFFLLVVLGGAGAAVIVPYFIDWSVYKKQLQDYVSAETGYRVDVGGKLSVRFLPEPALFVEGVQVHAGDHLLASFQRLDVHVALDPLLTGSVVVRSIDVTDPNITLEVSEQGEALWLTQQMKEKSAAQAEKAQAPSRQAKLSFNVDDILKSLSFDSVRIQNGTLSFRDHQKGEVYTLSGVDVAVQAQSFFGPYQAQGKISYAEEDIEFLAKIGALASGAKSVSVSSKFDYKGMEIKYAGAVQLAAPFDTQGEMSVNVPSISGTAKALGTKPVALTFDQASLKALVSASTKGLSFKAGALALGEQSLELDARVDAKPLVVDMAVRAPKALSLDPFLPQKTASLAAAGGSDKGKSVGSAGAGARPYDLGASLPKAMPLPPVVEGFSFKADIADLVYRGHSFGAVQFSAERAGTVLKGRVEAPALPGTAAASVGYDLSYQAPGQPVLDLKGKISSQNISASYVGLTGQDFPAGDFAKAGQFDFTGQVQPRRLELSESSLLLDGRAYTLSSVLDYSTLHASVKAFKGGMSIKTILAQDGSLTSALNNIEFYMNHPNLDGLLSEFIEGRDAQLFLQKPVEVSAVISSKDKIYDLTKIKAVLGQAMAQGHVHYDGSGAKPYVKSDIDLGHFILAANQTDGTAAEVSAHGVKKSGAGAPAKEGILRWSDEAIDVSWLEAFNMDATVKADSALLGYWNMESPSASVQLKDGVLSVPDFKTKSFSGDLSASGSVREDSDGLIVAQTKVEAKNVRIEPMLRSLAGRYLVRGSGIVDLAADLSTQGKHQLGLVSALKGKAVMTGDQVVLEGFDLDAFVTTLRDDIKPDDTLKGLWDSVSEGGSTPFDNIEGQFIVDKGIVNMTKLDLESATLGLKSVGKVDLPKWTIHTQHDMSLKNNEEIPPFRLIVQGSLDDPQHGFAEGALSQYLARKMNRKLEEMLAKKLGSEAAGKAMGGVLGGVIGDYAKAVKEMKESGQELPQGDARHQQFNKMLKDLLSE